MEEKCPNCNKGKLEKILIARTGQVSTECNSCPYKEKPIALLGLGYTQQKNKMFDGAS